MEITMRYIVFKLLKIRDKEKILKNLTGPGGWHPLRAEAHNQDKNKLLI